MVMSVCLSLSVCLSFCLSVTSRAYVRLIQNLPMLSNAGTMKVGYWMQYCDVITNPRWQTAANTKNDISAYLIENDPIMMKFGAPSQTMTLILTKVRIFKFNMVDKHDIG